MEAQFQVQSPSMTHETQSENEERFETFLKAFMEKLIQQNMERSRQVCGR